MAPVSCLNVHIFDRMSSPSYETFEGTDLLHYFVINASFISSKAEGKVVPVLN
jgi:hypothetical protein